MVSSDLSIVHVPIGELKSSEYNPRTFSEEDIGRVSESIRLYGLVDPCIVNGAATRRNIVIGGHLRIHCARRLDHETVPVVYVDIPDIEKEKGLNLRLNRLGGSWDWEKLKTFNLDLLCDCGFTDEDFSRIFDDALETEEDGFDVEKELETLKAPTVKVGDLYQLGSHRLIIGDSRDPAVVQRLMDGAKADLVDTDPPFAINLDYDRGVSGKKHYGGTMNDNMSPEEYEAFLHSLIGNAIAAAKPDAHFLFWCDANWIWLLQTLYKQLGIKHKRVCWWVKSNWSMTPGVAVNKAGEAAIYGTIGSPYLAPKITNLHELLDKEIGPGNRMIEDVIDLFSFWLQKRLPGSEYEHPTQKPPTLHEKLLRRTTRPGDIVLDLTAGSGSLMVACEQMRRRAYLAEIEPVFAELIIRRFESLTGQKASLLPND